MAEHTDWNSNLGGGFGQHQDSDEFFHGSGPAGDSLTETWFWNFHVAEANINCYAYCWVHPNLQVVTAGLMIYQGLNTQHLACELFDFYDYLSAATVVGDGSHIRLPNGFSAEVIKPLQQVRLRFADPARATSFEVILAAQAAPVMRANNQHFEQLMHATGHLTLRGQDYRVDCYPVRDRSWGELRPETHAPFPPYTWVTGAFGSDLAFNVGSHDDPALHPEWIGLLPVPPTIFKDGWVTVQGEQRRVVRASKSTPRELPSCRPLSHQYEFEDSSGVVYRMHGRIIAQTCWSGWSNMNCHLGLVEWDWNGRKGWGETQEVQWNDYVWTMHKRLQQP
jgi:hypothetical protein